MLEHANVFEYLCMYTRNYIEIKTVSIQNLKAFSHFAQLQQEQ